MVRLLTLISLFLLALGSNAVNAQNNDPWDQFPLPSGRRPREEDRVIRELMAKQQSEREKKEYAQLLERATQAEKLAAEIKKSLANPDRETYQNNREKLSEIRKLILKVRDGLGGGDDGEDDISSGDNESAPQSDIDAVNLLAETTASLAAEIRKSTRYSISVSAIENANTALRLLRFLRVKD